MKDVVLWWVGASEANPDLLERVRRRIASEYGAPARLLPAPGRPADTWDERRRQHASGKVLKWLLASRPPEALRVLGLTDADLFIPILTFVFGEAQLKGRAAVVSTARLSGPPAARLPVRLETEAVHELGHTFGLLHCHEPSCAMARSGNLTHVDAKRPALCRACRVLYTERADQIGDLDEQEEHPDPHRR